MAKWLVNSIQGVHTGKNLRETPFVSPTKHGRQIGIMSPSASEYCHRRPRCHTFCFRSITLEGIHKFHSIFTEGSNIIKYRSCAKKGVIRKILTALWPFFTCNLAKLWFQINIFWRDVAFSFKFYKRVKHHKIQVKFEYGGISQIFNWANAHIRRYFWSKSCVWPPGLT